MNARINELLKASIKSKGVINLFSDVVSFKKSAYTYELKTDNVYYKRLKKESVYASIEDILEFVKHKYSLDKIKDYSMQIHRFGGYEINFQGNKYIVEKGEVKQLEKVHIDEAIYCNEFKCCSLSWFYTSVGSELVPDDSVTVDDELIKKAANLLEYESEKLWQMGWLMCLKITRVERISLWRYSYWQKK